MMLWISRWLLIKELIVDAQILSISNINIYIFIYYNIISNYNVHDIKIFILILKNIDIDISMDINQSLGKEIWTPTRGAL